jgi:hypothetical protein
MNIRYLAIRFNPLPHLRVLSNVSSGAPEKNGSDVLSYDLVTFLEVAKSNEQRLAICRFTNF